MATPCLLPDQIQRFRRELKDKTLNLADLLHMEPDVRMNVLSGYAGENAKLVNDLFEQKLVLKNKMLGIKNWASKMGELGRYSPERKLELEKASEEYK